MQHNSNVARAMFGWLDEMFPQAEADHQNILPNQKRETKT